jgi:hypothetical protein
MFAGQLSYFFFFAAFFAFFLVAIFLFSLSIFRWCVTVSHHVVENIKSLKNDVKGKVKVRLLAGCARSVRAITWWREEGGC